MSMSTNEGNVTNVTVNLMFTGAYREDTGVYECSVSNLLNYVARNTNLIVQCTYVCYNIYKKLHTYIHTYIMTSTVRILEHCYILRASFLAGINPW